MQKSSTKSLRDLGITPEKWRSLGREERKLLLLKKRRRLDPERARAQGCPQTDDELHAWIKRETGMDLPRQAVCEDHEAPFSILADLFFERVGTEIEGVWHDVPGMVVLAARGCGKTSGTAAIEFANSTWKPGAGHLSFGSSGEQGFRTYENLEEWCYEHDDHGARTAKIKSYIDGEPLKSITKWSNGSYVRVASGSMKSVSGPHMPFVHVDEADQMDQPIYDQSRGISQSFQAKGPLPSFMDRFGGMIPPHDIVTSTMNSLHGIMKALIDEAESDLRDGAVPNFVVRTFCVFDVMQEVPSCTAVPKYERQDRLRELGRDENERCPCSKWRKGKLANGDDRTFESVCEGRAFRARGWRPHQDVLNKFKSVTPGMWQLQYECRAAQTERNYLQGWDPQQVGVKGYLPDPAYGPIYQGIDFGGTDPHCVLWAQYLRHEAEAYAYDGTPIYLAPGTYVFFREIYVAEIDVKKLADRVH
jgi:hypothetical protein